MEQTMKRVPFPTRLAATLTLAALAACGGAGDDTGSRSGATPTTTAPAASAPSPAADVAPAPAGGGSTPAPGPAPAPAPGAPVAPAPAPPVAIPGDPVRGKQLYSDLPNTVLSCEGCHTAAVNNIGGILAAAGDWRVIARAIADGKGGMNALAFPVLTGYDLQDIAAYLANPAL
jgi:hypothetical protein